MIGRDVAIPSQALGYKIGQLKFIELREYAQKDLGPKFDIRGFHGIDDGLGVRTQASQSLIHLLRDLHRHVEVALVAREQGRRLDPVGV